MGTRPHHWLGPIKGSRWISCWKTYNFLPSPPTCTRLSFFFLLKLIGVSDWNAYCTLWPARQETTSYLRLVEYAMCKTTDGAVYFDSTPSFNHSKVFRRSRHFNKDRILQYENKCSSQYDDDQLGSRPIKRLTFLHAFTSECQLSSLYLPSALRQQLRNEAEAESCCDHHGEAGGSPESSHIMLATAGGVRKSEHAKFWGNTATDYFSRESTTVV